MTTPIKTAELPDFEPLPGFKGKMIHTDQLTVAHWSIAAGSALPEHQHAQEMIVNMLEGEFELTVDGTPHLLKPGDVVCIPGEVPHAGRAITDTKILDVWHPARDDYKT